MRFKYGRILYHSVRNTPLATPQWATPHHTARASMPAATMATNMHSRAYVHTQRQRTLFADREPRLEVWFGDFAFWDFFIANDTFAVASALGLSDERCMVWHVMISHRVPKLHVGRHPLLRYERVNTHIHTHTHTDATYA